MIKTALYENHQKYGGKIVDFSGWALPVHYSSIIKEHEAVRNSTGIFDCSHMGNFIISGPDTIKFLDYFLTNNFSKIKLSKAVYSPMLYDNGTFVDDLIIYLMTDEEALLIVNASNTDKDFKWIEQKILDSSLDIKLYDQSPNYSLLAIQGKESDKVIEKLFPGIFKELNSFDFKEILYKDCKCIVAKTGYTGEQGIEVLVPNSAAPQLFDEAVDFGSEPCGLGARDSLRLEKGYPLYGNDIDDTTNPIEAGLSWAVDFSKKNFIGKEALVKIKKEGLVRRLKGFLIEGRAIARKGAKIYDEAGFKLGVVTSGIYSPILKKGIGMAYLPVDYKEKKILIEIHNKKILGIITKKSFV